MEVNSLSNQLSLLELNPLLLIFAFLAMALLPLALLAMTSFLKITIVLGMIRSALGAGQIPSASVTTLLALILTGYVMSPVALEVGDRLKKHTGSEFQQLKVEQMIEIGFDSLRPWQQFLLKHSGEEEQQLFRQLQPEGAEEIQGVHQWSWLIPAFVLTELREAFVIGFMLYLPFLAVDLIVANLLVGLGMVMVSPATISIPLKIFLFVASDAWLLLTRSLVLGYWPVGAP